MDNDMQGTVQADAVRAVVEQLESDFADSAAPGTAARYVRDALRDLRGSIRREALPEMAFRLAAFRLKTLVESSSDTEIALLDRRGTIVWVNRQWTDFCRDNGGDPARTGPGTSYLAVCTAAGDTASLEVAAAIDAALTGELPAPMALHIPCDAPGVARTFDMLISSRLGDNGTCVGASVTLSLAGSTPGSRT